MHALVQFENVIPLVVEHLDRGSLLSLRLASKCAYLWADEAFRRKTECMKPIRMKDIDPARWLFVRTLNTPLVNMDVEKIRRFRNLRSVRVQDYSRRRWLCDLMEPLELFARGFSRDGPEVYKRLFSIRNIERLTIISELHVSLNFYLYDTNFAALTLLTRLDLSGSQIEVIPPSVFRIARLEHLILANCGLNTIFSEISMLTALKTLDLSQNDFHRSQTRLGICAVSSFWMYQAASD